VEEDEKAIVTDSEYDANEDVKDELEEDSDIDEKAILDEILRKRVEDGETNPEKMVVVKDDDEESGVSTDFEFLLTDSDAESIGSEFSAGLSNDESGDDSRKKNAKKASNGKRPRGKRAGQKFNEKRHKKNRLLDTAGDIDTPEEVRSFIITLK
jgi:hypothetical protein